jgi:AcrR family transcriptional regulator
MNANDKSPSARRAYNAPTREAAAERTKIAILTAAKRLFETRGWSGTTVGAIADDAGVSAKTVEAVFGTKARLLEATVTFSIRGDVKPVEMLRRDHIVAMEETPTAAEMLRLHAAHLRRVNARSAGVAFAVEQAAASDSDVARLWEQMSHNRLVGVRWAARTLRAKPQTAHLTQAYAESVFLVAFDWGTYRVLTGVGRLSGRRYEAWLRAYYDAMLLSTHA